MDQENGLDSLMVLYQQGDLAAATALVNRVSPRLHRYFLVRFVSRRYADDLLQETWLRIHEVRHTYRPGHPVLPWLYAIARNVRVDHFRKVQRTETREQNLDAVSAMAQTPAVEPAGDSDLETLLATLPESQREVISMLKITGMSLEEVARATSSSVGSVKQKAHRAYEKLREYLSGREGRTARRGGPS
jgi:RNA polymerase sigma-70 factor (ECF subfamily)